MSGGFSQTGRLDHGQSSARDTSPARSVEGFASGFVGGDEEQLDLAESELAVDLLGIERKDIFGSLQDRLGDEGGTVGAGFNATEQVVEGLGIGSLATHLVFDAAGTDHGRHLRSKPDEWLRDVRNTGLPSRCQVAQNGMTVRRAKASFFSGCNSHLATVAPASSNRSGSGGNDTAEAFDAKGRVRRPREQAGHNMCERRAGLEKIILREPTQRTFGEGRRRRTQGSNPISATIPPG
jgi:hypothetical protein